MTTGIWKAQERDTITNRLSLSTTKGESIRLAR